MIAELLQKRAGMERRDCKYAIRPSAVSPEIPELGYKGRCKRQMVYHALNYPVDNTNDRMMLVMDDSSWHEELTADWINKTSWQLSSRQMEVDCGYFGTGHIDGVLKDILGNEYLFEHKAINHFSYERYVGGELPIDYIAQCCVYLNQELREYDINQAVLLIKNKNTAQYCEFLIQYDKQTDMAIILHKQDSTDQEKKDLNVEIPKILERCKKKFEFVAEKARQKKLPLREYSYTEWQCLYCPYMNTCWEDYKEEFENLAENIELSNDLEERLGYYLELQMHLKEMEKEQDKIKEEIKQIMREKGARQATTAKYAIILSLIESKRIDKEKIPPDILEQATVHSLSERMTIKLKKEVKENGKSRH